MKVLVTGVTGQLGFDVMRVLRGRDANAVGATRSEMPLNDPARTRAFVLETHTDAVIHCGAYTAVDRAEDEQSLCRTINGTATGEIAAACEEIGVKYAFVEQDNAVDTDPLGCMKTSHDNLVRLGARF